MNVLKRIIIPKIEHTIRYILTELEELEREDTFRLKRVKQNNMKRAKQRIKQDGAGERIEVIEPTKKEDKLETKSKSVAESVAAEKPEKDKESGNIDKELPVQPKEAAEMGDLIVIKPAEDTLEVGDVLGPTGLKNMGIVTEAKEVIDQSALDEKENKVIDEIIPDKTKVDENVVTDDLEAGEWFETANTTVNKISEYSKMDKYEDVLGSKRLTDDNSITSVDLDKRALESLFKSIDSNFYKPTIDDLFSKHDIAVQDEVSEHSLVDLESIDFSIDSKGKVIPSRHGTGQSSPAISYRGEDIKPHVKYSTDGFIIRPSMERQSLGQADGSLQPKVENKVMEEDVDKITKPNVQMMVENNVTDMSTGDLIEQRLDVDNVEKNIDKQDLQDSKSDDAEQVNDKDVLEIQKAQGTEDIEKSLNTKLGSESKPKQNIEDDNVMQLQTRISRSISDEKLSKISEEDNLEADTSKLSTVVEEPVELRENDIKGSMISDKLHKSEISKTIKENEQNSDINLNKEMPENTEVAKAIKHSPDKIEEDDRQGHASLTIDDKHFQPIRSARSSRDLHNINMKNMDQKPIMINQEFPNTLNSITEEEEASRENNDMPVKEESMNIDKAKLQSTIQSVDNTVKTKSFDKGEEINPNDEENKHINDLKDTTEQKSNNTLDVEEKPPKIRDSTEIAKSKLEVKMNTGQMDLKHIKEDTSIQLKRKSQLKQQTENKPLTIKTSDEIIESKEDNTQKDNKTDDTDKDKEEKEKKEREDKVERDRPDDESSPSADKPERHSGDDHLKQD